MAQFIVPFHIFAQHSALIEALLTPMDDAVAGCGISGLGDRRAPGGQQHGHVFPRRIHDTASRIGGADGHMHHDGGHLAASFPIARSHMDGDIFVRDDHKLGHLATHLAGFGEAFDERRKIGAGIGEDVADPLVAEGLQISLGDRGGFCARVVHEISPHFRPAHGFGRADHIHDAGAMMRCPGPGGKPGRLILNIRGPNTRAR